jgi:hypothetical protein
MPSIPVGFRQVDSSILPRGMSSYVNSMMKTTMDFQEIGAYVNGRSITVLIENGELMCVEVNKVFMKKVIGHEDVNHVSIQEEVNVIKPDLDPELLASIFTEPDHRFELVQSVNEDVIAENRDYGEWTKTMEPIQPNDLQVSIVNPYGQWDTTRFTALGELDEMIEEKGESILNPNFWTEKIPEKDRANFLSFLKNMKSDTEFFVFAGRLPLINVKALTYDVWTSEGNKQSCTEMIVHPPAYRGVFPSKNLIPDTGPVKWILFSVYYLLYWIFKMIEINLGKEFDGNLTHPGDGTDFLKTPTWHPDIQYVI